MGFLFVVVVAAPAVSKETHSPAVSNLSGFVHWQGGGERRWFHAHPSAVCASGVVCAGILAYCHGPVLNRPQPGSGL